MAVTRALAAGTAADDFRGNEQIEDSELSVTSAQDDNLRAFLPAIEDGATTTVAAGYQVLVQANAAGDVEIVDVFGRRVIMVQPGESVNIKANGDVLRPVWTVSPAVAKLALGEAPSVSGTTTPALGTTSPAASATVIWIPVQKLDGTTGFLALWS